MEQNEKLELKRDEHSKISLRFVGHRLKSVKDLFLNYHDDFIATHAEGEEVLAGLVVRDLIDCTRDSFYSQLGLSSMSTAIAKMTEDFDMLIVLAERLGGEVASRGNVSNDVIMLALNKINADYSSALTSFYSSVSSLSSNHDSQEVVKLAEEFVNEFKQLILAQITKSPTVLYTESINTRSDRVHALLESDKLAEWVGVLRISEFTNIKDGAYSFQADIEKWLAREIAIHEALADTYESEEVAAEKFDNACDQVELDARDYILENMANVLERGIMDKCVANSARDYAISTMIPAILQKSARYLPRHINTIVNNYLEDNQ